MIDAAVAETTTDVVLLDGLLDSSRQYRRERARPV
jgi:hypothetical protein